MIKINGKQYETKEVIVVEVGDKSYSLPLAQYLPYKVIKKMMNMDRNDMESIIEILDPFIPREAIEEMSIVEIQKLIETWNDVQTKTDDGEELKN